MNLKKEQLLHEIAAKYILGKNIDIDIKGSTLQLECFQQLLTSSKRLKELLDDAIVRAREMLESQVALRRTQMENSILKSIEQKTNELLRW